MRLPGAPRVARIAAAGAVLALGFGAGDAGAAIYRCLGPHGMSFRDKPCGPSEQQKRIGADASPFAGCFQVEDSGAWEGGAGSWRINIIVAEGTYVFREMAEVRAGVPQEPQTANLPMHRASVDELQHAAAELQLRVTSGLVIELPTERERTMGLFNAWDQDGKVRLVAYLPFVNGFMRRVACP